MQIGFRCDATTEFGWGHFARCLTMAEMLAERGAKTRFYMFEPNVQIRQLLNQNSFTLVTLNSQSQSLSFEQETLDLLIVDHYRLDKDWWLPVKQNGTAIMIMNDQGVEQPEADIIWDVAALPDSDTYTDSLAHSNQLHLAGPKFVLLRDEFSKLATKSRQSKSRQSKSRQSNSQETTASKPDVDFKLLISVGATDPENTANLLLDWLNTEFDKQQQKKISITLLSASANPHLPSLQQRYPSVNYEIDSNRVAEIMAEQDLILTAAGNMMWEAFSLGVPCALLKTCENQSRNLQLIQQTMTDVYLGQEGSLQQSRVVCTLLNLITNPHRLETLKTLAKNLCDGQGANRVAGKLIDFIRDRHDRTKPNAK